MAVWLVRAGRTGQDENLALDNDLVTIEWENLPDLSAINTREALEKLMGEIYSTEKPATVKNWVGQVWAFRDRIQKGDLAVLPLKSRSAIAIGKVAGDYQYRSDLGGRHVREVEWIRRDIPRSSFDQDILYSFGAFMTVCQIQRNRAEERIHAVIEGKKLPRESAEATEEEAAAAIDVAATPDLEEVARDQIVEIIGQRFRGHALANLVTALLNADGYQTETSPPGPDGGMDIIAGRGPLGFEVPRLLVQVKSSDQPVDVKVLRELQGVIKNFGAQQGLLVAWGGFRQSVLVEARRLFFEIRLWDAGNLVDALLENYDRLPESIQAELPLKRIWISVSAD